MPALDDDAVITYAFHDSSVPPRYHRSVTLTMSRQTARMVVDSYGSVLADETRATPDVVWRGLAEALPMIEGRSVEVPAQGCTGGTRVDVFVDTGGTRVVDLRPEFCGGVNADLRELVRTWIAPALALFPPVSELAPEGD
jgi:hypothetical protein